ncbi:MAG: anthranilate synthase component I family protein, partial [Actinobacteria bacterium]|nr:anthranilate synthase component I family protein [Actinomycetota bacterium]
MTSKILEEGNLSGLFTRILSQNPAPFAGYLSLPGLEIASASPERFFSKDGSR